MSNAFSLRCLGSPSLFTDSGEQVRFRTRKHFALLIRLALDPGKPFTRDYLADLLWPGAEPKLANHSLAQGLSVIKAKIAREAVLLQRSTVGLAAGWVDVDVHHLTNGAVGVDGPFLDSFEIPAARPFEEWKDECRARLMPQMRDCLVRQMDAARRIGDFPTVERHALRLRELDQLAEEAIRGIMEARAWASDRSGALKAFARYEEQIEDELGAKPSADLVRMADLLRDGRRSPPRPAVPGAPPERVERRFEPETLIGREREFSVLYDAWLEARRKNPRIVVVTSDPGVGKTTLVNAFASTCQMDGAIVARAQAYDAERELPFAVLGELVKQLATQRAIGSADPEALSELTRISGEVLRVFPGVPSPTDWSPELTPLRIADAFLKTLVAAAENSPLLLVIDDVHAADNASTAILHVIARKITGTRLMIIATGRSSELRLSSAAFSLASDDSLTGLLLLVLEVLSNNDGAKIVKGLASRDVLEDLPTERILRAGGGNPLAIELLTKEWIAHGSRSLLGDLEALDALPSPAFGIPRAVHAIFERQSGRLGSYTRAALHLAAILGRRLSDLELYSAVDLSHGVAAQALSTLRQEGFLREVRGELEFRNELVRAQAYYSIAVPIRAQLHQRVAKLLSGGSARDNAAQLEIGWHFLRGGMNAEATSHGIRGAEDALASGAPAEAQQILEALLKLEPGSETSSRIRLMLAKALLDRSEADRAAPVLHELLNSPSLTPRDHAEVCRLIAGAEFLMAKSPKGIRSAAAEKAIHAARATSDVELVLKALLEYARTCKMMGDEEGLRRAREEANEIALSAPHLCSVHLIRAYCDFYMNEFGSALTSMEKALELSSENLPQLAFIYTGLGTSTSMLCDFERAEDYLNAALKIAQGLGDDSRCSRICSNLTLIQTAQGQYERAISSGEQSIRLAKRNPNQPEVVTSYANLGDAYLLTGQGEAARKCLEHAQEWVASHNDWQMTVVLLLETASRSMTTGNVPHTLNVLKQVENLTGGRVFSVQGGLLAKLEVLRAVHTQGPEEGKRVAESRKEMYRVRAPFFYLDTLAAAAWAEKLCDGSYSAETVEELQYFRACGAMGKWELLRIQGFLS